MAERTWTHDASHYPEPLTPLSADIWLWAMGLGMQAAARELRAPFGGFDTMVHAGGWAYEADVEPDWEPDLQQLESAALEVADRWERELKPRSHEITAELRRLRPERGGPSEAAAMFERLLDLVREQWRIHFLTVVPVHAARELLHDAYVELFGKGDELEPYRLIEGLPNETLEADEELWEVAQLARSLEVADVISELPAPAALRRLGETHDGREVLAALWEYLRRFGGRSRLHELSEPRDAERPELVLESVRLFLEHPRDLPAERRTKAREREKLEADVLGRISEPGRRGSFADLLTCVKAAVELEETHAYHIDYPGLAAVREALLGFGRRLVAEGRLDTAGDVFMLTRDELAEALAEPWGTRFQELVAERSADRDRARSTLPEPFVGPPPDPEAEISAMVAKFYGVPGSASHDGDCLRGTGASAGEATGVARIVRGPEDFGRVGAGEVLVCATTTPAWTPLFPSLAALVTDTGGILCHAAVVAREYGLPAVVGTEAATRAVPDGAVVRVDGAIGVVRIIRSPESGRPRPGEAGTVIFSAMDPRVEEYAERHTTPADGLLAEVAAATFETMPTPGMMSGIPESRLLEALVVVSGARRVLEIGTFTGFGALSMAARLPPGGELVTIEFDHDTADIARHNIERSPHADKITLIVGDAREEVPRLDGEFDLVFIDAWKADYMSYYEDALPKLSPRGLIVADNVLWRGQVLDPDEGGAEARGVAAFNDHVQADPRVRNVLLTIGDGYMLAWRDTQSGHSP